MTKSVALMLSLWMVCAAGDGIAGGTGRDDNPLRTLPPRQPQLYPHGLYVGAYGGSSFPAGTFSFSRQAFDSGERDIAISGGGFLGYEMFIPYSFYSLYVALEGVIGIDDAHIDETSIRVRGNPPMNVIVRDDDGTNPRMRNVTDLHATAREEVAYFYGADVRFGYKDGAWLVYVLGGWQRTRLEWTGSLRADYRVGADTLFVRKDSINERWINGVRFGGGLEYAMRGQWFVRLDYVHAFYADRKGALVFEVQEDSSFVMDSSPYLLERSDNRLRVSLGYRF
ncbi:MAG: outer membrane beta-barrel protein [Alphaproteobacteria bacterium GM7ARS4]|nr:outer membrane beta-barrel protein [Alphaproteobacteria bacterium GM7ARS4]